MYRESICSIWKYIKNCASLGSSSRGGNDAPRSEGYFCLDFKPLSPKGAVGNKIRLFLKKLIDFIINNGRLLNNIFL